MDVLVIGAGVVGLACARALALARPCRHRRREDRRHRQRRVVAQQRGDPRRHVLSDRLAARPPLRRRAAHALRLLREPRRAAHEMRQAHRRDERPRAGQDRGHPPAGPGERRRRAWRSSAATRRAPWSRSFRRSAAVHSPETGIVDSHAFMLALQGDLEDAGGVIAFNTTIERLTRAGRGWEVHFGGAEAGEMPLDAVVNSASLGAQALARATEGYPPERVPQLVLAKGNYFGCLGRPAFSRLIYPAPVEGGLGTHVTLDLAGRMRFGPDVEWIERGGLRGRSEPGGAVLRLDPALLAGAARRRAGARLFRHPPEAHRPGRAGGRFRHRRAGRARPLGPGPSLRHRIARA